MHIAVRCISELIDRANRLMKNATMTVEQSEYPTVVNRTINQLMTFGLKHETLEELLEGVK